jgi:zinc/manganese transport system permease protein
LLAGAVGVAGYLLGLVLSALFDLPTGAVIVWSLAGLAVMMGAIVNRKSTDQARIEDAP